MDENLAMMWLTRSLGLNLKKVKHLLSVCQRAEQVYAMTAGQLRHLAGVDETMVSALEKGKQILPAWQKEMEQAKVRFPNGLEKSISRQWDFMYAVHFPASRSKPSV